MHSVDFDRLPNGLRVVSIQRPHIHRAVVAVFAEVGSRHETPRTNGLSHFLEHMLFRGTRRHRTAQALNHAIETLGASLGAATHSDYTRFDMTAPPDSLTAACRLLGDVFTTPVFSQVDVEKKIVREEILENLDDDHRDVNADNLSRLQVFGRHPLGYPITGTLENVERFTARDLRAHLGRYYRASNMVVAVCSPLPRRHVARAVARGFANLPAGGRTPPRIARVTQRRAKIQNIGNAGSQTSVRLAFPTPGEETRMARAIEVLLRVLDDGMSTRLHRRVCDELGLAYEISAGIELFRDVGVMDVASSVAHNSVPRLVTEVLSILGDLATDGPSRAELEKVQRRYAFDLAALDDDPHALADHYGAAALGDRTEAVEVRRRQVLALTLDDLRRAARVVFTPSRLNLTTIGPPDVDTRRALSECLRRFRTRLAATTATARLALRPPVRVRSAFVPRIIRNASVLDSLSVAP
jgi:predicted Zn-dependent peptidase